jgi:hypothetical protein
MIMAKDEQKPEPAQETQQAEQQASTPDYVTAGEFREHREAISTLRSDVDALRTKSDEPLTTHVTPEELQAVREELETTRKEVSDFLQEFSGRGPALFPGNPQPNRIQREAPPLDRKRAEQAIARGGSVLHDRKIYTRLQDIPPEAFNDPKLAEKKTEETKA